MTTSIWTHLELIKVAEGGVDEVCDSAPGCAASVRSHRVPVEGVVPDLRGVVVDGTGRGREHDLLHGLALKLGPGDELVDLPISTILRFHIKDSMLLEP